MPAECCIARSAAPRLVRGARDADDVEIVFGRGNARSTDPLDQPADRIELALPFRLLAQKDMRTLCFLDRARGQRQLHHIQREPELLHLLALAVQLVKAPFMRVARRVDADMRYAKLRPHTIVAV